MKNMEQGRMKSPNDHSELIRRIMLGTFTFISVIMVAELIHKIYQFNAVVKRRTYYERLDPRELT